ncbi:RNA polymerase sigma factor [Bdellovibrio sp. HCB2-146]|uniref:RNA polymerase sigma factor n=1 Tax=Bdellovibrio sp. HCB2-146 TaxID=3394362 RepID=UPI0039BC99F7
MKKLEDHSDEELLNLLADGDPKALDVLYLRHSGRVLSYALKRGLTRDQSEDLLQIVFMQVYRKKHLYNAKYSALAWIYVISRSELKDYRNRELKNFAELPLDLSQNDDLTPIKEETEELLGQLKGREQEVIRLRYLDELEYKEIAEVLNESESNIRQIVSRSLKFLKGLSAKKGES